MGSLFRQAGRNVWMMKYYQHGRATFESSGTDIKDEARDKLRTIEGKIADGEQVSNVTGKLRFETAVADVVNDYTANQRRSIGDVKRRIDLHLTPYFGGRRMTAITSPQVRAYVAARLAEGAKPATVNRELAIVKRAFKLSPIKTVPKIAMLVEKNVRTGFFEREAFEAVVRNLPEPYQPVMRFAFLTGWRVRSEILPLTWAQVDETAQTVRLEPGTTKNDEARTFPYGALPELAAVVTAQAAVRDAFRKQGKICPLVFPDPAGQPLTPFYSDVWRAACKAAGCPGKIPHDFRRTAVRNLSRAGAPDKTSMLLTGHKTRSVFDRYRIVTEDDLREAVAKLAAVPAANRKRRA